MNKLLSVLLSVIAVLLLATVSFGVDLLGYPKFQAFDDNGDLLASGKLYTYEVGSTTNKATYSDTSGTTNTNPVILDSRGEAVIYFDGSYKLVLKDSDDTTIWTFDNFQGTGVEYSTSSGTSGYIVLMGASGTSALNSTPTISGVSITDSTITDAKLTGTLTKSVQTVSDITGRIFVINLTGNPDAIAGGKTGTTISGESVYGGWTKSGTSAQIGTALTEVTAIMTSPLTGMSHVFRIMQDTAQSGGTINVLFEAGDNIVSQTAIIAGTSKYILSGTTNSDKLILTASGTSEWEVDEIGSPSVNWD